MIPSLCQRMGEVLLDQRPHSARRSTVTKKPHSPVTDVKVIGSKLSLLLFLCGRETSSETRMKFQPYLRECIWDLGTQQEKRASTLPGFLLLSSCAKYSLPYLKVFNTAGILNEYWRGVLLMSLPLFAYCHQVWPAL